MSRIETRGGRPASRRPDFRRLPVEGSGPCPRLRWTDRLIFFGIGLAMGLVLGSLA